MLQPVGELDGLVEVDEMTGVFDQLELRSRDRVRETMSAVDGNPGVVATPKDKNGEIEAWIQRFDLVGVGLIGLVRFARRTRPGPFRPARARRARPFAVG